MAISASVAVAADVPLALNDLRLIASENDYAELVLAVARGETSKAAAAEVLRSNTEPAS